MTVTKRPPAKKATEKKIETFIASAPDSAKVEAEKKPLMRGKREQISHTIPPDILEKLDKVAKMQGITRAGLINIAISEYIRKSGI
jgi:hypothetical protein